MATTTTCDRCGNNIPADKVYKLQVQFYHPDESTLVEKNFDICPNCRGIATEIASNPFGKKRREKGA